MKQKSGLWIALWLVLVVVTGFLAFGHGYGGRGYGPWHGWGHMGGWDERYSADDAPGWHGFGSGMMPGLPQNLTEEQSKKLNQFQGEAEKENRSLMQQRLDAQSRLNSLYASDKRDWNAIRAATKTLAELQRKQMDAAIEMQQKIDGLLSDSQRQEMARSARNYGWMR